MILDNIYQVHPELVFAVEWLGDELLYDLQLYELEDTEDEFWVLNPDYQLQKEYKTDLKYYINELPTTKKCIVIMFEGNWIAKIFKRGWYPYHGYETVEIIKPKLIWSKNPDIDILIEFENNPYGKFEPTVWDRDYRMTWYLDPRVNPIGEKVWAFKCEPIDINPIGDKDMGYVMPLINVEFNEHLPKLNIDINKYYPAYWELNYDHVYELDPIHQTDRQLWAIKYTPASGKSDGWKWAGTVAPEMEIEYNPDLGDLNYTIDYVIPWHDLNYEHVWMLDNKHKQPGEEEIWAFKIKMSENTQGSIVVGYISPEFEKTVNPDLQHLKFDTDYYVFPWHDLQYEHIWYIEIDNKLVWAANLSATSNSIGIKDMGIVEAELTQLDVIFISYHEKNAEENWQRVLEKAPYAKRVDGVKGIFEAHKQAANLSNTDMFYVVDGDAWLVDEWEFNFQPSLFDRDCAYVWSSKNPVNDLTYQYGGVKLFNKSTLKKKKKWTTIDMFSTMPKIKAEDTISCITNFNVDEFSTWRSAFRESVKLYISSQLTRLDGWLLSNKKKRFGKFAVAGAEAGIQYAKDNIKNKTALLQINDYDWLREHFDRQLGKTVNAN